MAIRILNPPVHGEFIITYYPIWKLCLKKFPGARPSARRAGVIDTKTRVLSNAIGQFRQVRFYPYFKKSLHLYNDDHKHVVQYTRSHHCMKPCRRASLTIPVPRFGFISHSTTQQSSLPHLGFQVVVLVDSHRMYARRAYSKARTGCLQCKQRKIKVRE